MVQIPDSPVPVNRGLRALVGLGPREKFGRNVTSQNAEYIVRHINELQSYLGKRGRGSETSSTRSSGGSAGQRVTPTFVKLRAPISIRPAGLSMDTPRWESTRTRSERQFPKLFLMKMSLCSTFRAEIFPGQSRSFPAKPSKPISNRYASTLTLKTSWHRFIHEKRSHLLRRARILKFSDFSRWGKE